MLDKQFIIGNLKKKKKKLKIVGSQYWKEKENRFACMTWKVILMNVKIL